MKLGLQYVGILTADIASSLEFYVGCLGMQIVAPDSGRDCNSTVYLWDGNPACKVLIRLAEPPFSGWLEQDYLRNGPGIDNLSFLTADLQDSEQVLRAAGVEIVHANDSVAAASGISFRDTAGVHILLSGTEDTIAFPSTASGGAVERRYGLSHLCHTSREATAHKVFYRDTLRLETLRELPEDGMLFLGDPLTLQHPERQVCPLELIAEPGLWELENAFLSRRGAGLQWICFTTKNVVTAHAQLTERQVPCTLEPTEYRDTVIAFYRDPNGVDIEILLSRSSSGAS